MEQAHKWSWVQLKPWEFVVRRCENRKHDVIPTVILSMQDNAPCTQVKHCVVCYYNNMYYVTQLIPPLELGSIMRVIYHGYGILHMLVVSYWIYLLFVVKKIIGICIQSSGYDRLFSRWVSFSKALRLGLCAFNLIIITLFFK